MQVRRGVGQIIEQNIPSGSLSGGDPPLDSSEERESVVKETNPELSNADFADTIRKNSYIALAIIFAIALSDQLTKIWAVGALTNAESIRVIGDFVRFTLVYNYGGAMGTDLGGSTVYLISGIAILAILMVYLYTYRRDLRVTVALALIAGGAVGNLIDRARLGRVVDWVDIDIPDISLFGWTLQRWWTFNIADAAITLSLISIVVVFISRGRADKRAPLVDSPSSSGESIAEDINQGDNISSH